MSASHEWYEWHLTPGGWVEGTEHMDHGTLERPTPTDRVATYKLDEYMGSVFSAMHRTWQRLWQAEGVDIAPLLREHGEHPADVAHYFQ